MMSPNVKLTRAGTSPKPVLQYLAIFLCLVVGIAMIVNTQLSGEAMWFWYGTVFHQGVKLYSNMHTALQPLFVLLTDAWMTLFGKKLLVYEIPSVLHILVLAVGIFLILRESTWPDWQKAIVLAGTFFLVVGGHSYRFDDYHVLAEEFLFYSMLVLLRLARVRALRNQFLLVAALGVLCGLTITTRLTDGAALTVASVITLPFLLREKKAQSVALLIVLTGITIVGVVHLTGDSFKTYVFSSVIRAAGSKGGTGSIFAAPWLMLVNTVVMLRRFGFQIFLEAMALAALGYALWRYKRMNEKSIVGLQLAAAALLLIVIGSYKREELAAGKFISVVVLYVSVGMYFFIPVVLARWSKSRGGDRTWDAREILVLLPIAEWASYSAGAAAEPLTNYYAPIALLLLLVVVLQPMKKQAGWFFASLVTMFALIAISGVVSKAETPYSWQNYRYPPMFVGREWYRHPVYGEMYIDRDLLQFSEAVCRDIGSVPGKNAPELLSLPYPYPNYFCVTNPWHNYVQTFFDTAQRATIEQLMRELETSPPQYIVYQRQLNIMRGSERLYNHGRPLAQRALDTMIAQKIATGQWQLIDQSNYLPCKVDADCGWFIIRTRPS